MKKSILIIGVFLSGIFLSCNTSISKFETPEGIKMRNDVDQNVSILDQEINSFNFILRIDHSRLAEAVDVYTPSSIVTLFSNPKVNSELLKINQLVGIDLPYKVLSYSEPELTNPSITYTSPEFLMKRHGLSNNDVAAFSNDINLVIKSYPNSSISSTDLRKVDKDFGLIIKKSDFDFVTTIENLKKDIQAQGDTQIFGEIDFKKEAAEYTIEIDPTILILFGAPAPGGKAMNKTPKIGLDAFCQKLLVFEKDSSVFIAYNDIVEFSKLYYQKGTNPQRVVNYRLNKVYGKAISKK